MKNSKIDFSFTSYEIFDENGKNIIGRRDAKKIINFKMLKKSCDIGLSTVIIKKH